MAVTTLPPPAADQLDIWWVPRAALPLNADRAGANHRLRHDILRRYLGDDAPLGFFRDADGKPGLACDDFLHFNFADCDGMAAVVIGADMDVGIDCERVRPQSDLADVAAMCFCENEQALLARAGASAFTPLFYCLWTRKEAVLKALGLGLSLPLARIDVAAADLARASPVIVPSHGVVWVASLRAPTGWAGGCAARRPFTVVQRT